MKHFLSIFLILIMGISYGQKRENKPYDPDADAKKIIEKAVAKAKAENKHVLIQVGGNW